MARASSCARWVCASLAIDRALRTDVPFIVAGIVTLLEETKPGMHLFWRFHDLCPFDVLGIGNAIVDVISRADDAFLPSTP